jgi:hypothetical protein
MCMKLLLFKSFLGFVFVHIFFWVVHRSEVSIILLLDHHPICLKYGRDYPTFACICNRTTYSRSLYTWSHLCCNNPNAIWSKGLYLIHTSSTQFTNKNQELHELCWSLTDQWVWQEVGSNTWKGWVLVLWSIWRVHANCKSRNPEIGDCNFFCVITFVKNNEQKEIYGHQSTHQYKWCYQLLPNWFKIAKMMLVEKLPS